jgi:hypothetical protein
LTQMLTLQVQKQPRQLVKYSLTKKIFQDDIF